VIVAMTRDLCFHRGFCRLGRTFDVVKTSFRLIN
jgi:hypothetical protein